MERILILIVTYNGAKYIDDCLASIERAGAPTGAETEILVVDNASTDETAALVRRRGGVRLIENAENLGFAGGNNVGLRWAAEHNFDYVYLLNQDTEVAPAFLEEALRLARTDEKVAAVQSKLLLFDDKARINSIGNVIHYLGFGYAGGYGEPDREMEPCEITYPSGASVLLRLEAIREVGFFNEELFLYHEDLDLGWRLRLAGRRILLAPRSVVYHKYRFSKNKDQFFYMERNRYLVILQNYRAATLLLIAPSLAAFQLGMFAYAAVSGNLGAQLRVCAHFARPAAWRRLFKRRRQVQAARRLPDREIVRRFVGRVEFEGLPNPILKYVANPIFAAYWSVAKRLIRW